MFIYTKKGDGGYTSLLNEVDVPKYDSRIELLGTIDELSSFIGLAKAIAESELKERLNRIQQDLMQIMAKIADLENPRYSLEESKIAYLEDIIDTLEKALPRTQIFVLCGGCELSARLDVARTIARRAERLFWMVKKEYGADLNALRYFNRLSDYLYAEARYAECQNNIKTT